jgi:hypothetical protein
MKARLSPIIAAILFASIPGVAAAQQWSSGSGGAIYYNGGNVGIGTPSPGASLDIAGTSIIALRINGTTGNTGSNNTQLRFAGGTTGDLWAIGTDLTTNNGSKQFQFYDLQANIVPLTLQQGTGNVGIGTTTPGYQLTLWGPSVTPATGDLALFTPGAASGERSSIPLFSTFANYPADKYPRRTADIIAGFATSSANPDGVWGGEYLSFNVGDNGASDDASPSVMSEKLRILGNGNVGIGTTNPAHLLHVAGTIGAEEVIVSATGADYVFQPNYHLAPLSDVSTYIQENHHLPGIPSAAEMLKDGVSLGDLQVKLLAKVEELTLHMIQSEERSNRLQAENQELQKQIDVLKRRIER